MSTPRRNFFKSASDQANLRESLSKEATPEQIAKLLPILAPVAEEAIHIERHDNRYFFDSDTVYFDNLIGAYIEGDKIIPIRLGLKHSRSGASTLYVMVDQNTISRNLVKETKKDTGHQDASPDSSSEASNLRRRVTYSIADIFSFVKSKDLLRYVPDQMLDEAQRKAKWEAMRKRLQRQKKKRCM